MNINDRIEDKPPFFFEGTEKNMKLLLKGSGDITRVSRQEWQVLLDHVKCKILSEKKNEFIHSYLLSESSLFVQPKKILLKTCGETTLLAFLEPFRQFLLKEKIDLKIDSILFTRKTYLQPKKQKFPHKKFKDEIAYMDNFFGNKGISKDFGSFFLYTNGLNKTLDFENMKFFELLMNELSQEKMKQFYKNELTAREVSDKSGITKIIMNSKIDDYLFEPCGYSSNGIKNEVYYSIHVTPEETHSYVSYECNIKDKEYIDVSNRIVNVFGPGEFIIASLHRKDETIPNNLNSFNLKQKESLKISEDYFFTVHTFSLK